MARASGWQELLLIRHAATDMTGTLCGHSDPPLNAIGRAQATGLTPLLRSCKVRRLYVSDLQRAAQTAQPLAELWGIPVVMRQDLREISFGSWEGRRWSEVRGVGTDIRTMELSTELGALGGETFASFRDRVLRALNEILGDANGLLTAIVTHLGVIRVALNELSPENSVWDPRQRIDHCSVHRLRVSGPSVTYALGTSAARRIESEKM